MTDLVSIGFVADTRQLKTAETDLNRLSAAGGRLDGDMSALTKTIGVLGAAFAALGSAQLARELIAQSDAWRNINSQLRQVSQSEADLINQRTMLLKLSKDTRSDLKSTVDLYTTLIRATSDLGISQAQVADITGTINNLFLANGKSATEAAGAIRQLAQGLSAGALRGDEFNSVAEGAPRIMDALAEKLRMTRGELREFAATGGITAEILVNALQEYQQTAQTMADQTEKTFGQSIQNANTNITEFVGGMESITAASAALGDGIEFASENIDAIIKSAGAAALVLTASMIPALYKTSAGFVVATAESIRYQIALARMVGVSATAAVATTALGTAVKVALGPIGLVIAVIGTAALTFNSYATETDLAKRSSAELKTEIEQLSGSMEKLNKEQAAYLQVRITERMEQIETTLSQMGLAAGATSEELQAIFGDRFQHAVVESAKVTSELKDEMARLKTQSAELSTIINGSSAPAVERLTKAQKEAIKAADKLRESFAGQVLSLEMQRQQLILSADEFELLKAKMDAIAYGATPAMIAGIEASVKALQNLRNASNGLDSLMDGGLFAFEDVGPLKIDTLIDQAKDLGGAWSQAGSDIINAFGGVSSVIGDYANRMEDLIDLQGKLSAERAKYADGSAEAARADLALAEIQQDMFASNIGAVSKLAGVTAKAFKEQSKERQALHRLETAFAAVEIALAAEKAVANAVAAVANQGSGDPYTAFGRIAAMIGIMAGVLGVAGIAFGGSSGSAPSTNSGSGTALGSDDPSASVSNSAAAFEDIALDQLAELRGIRDAMNGLSNGIANLATSLITGGQLGGAGVTGLGTTSQFSGNMMNAFFGGERLIDKLLGGTLNGLVDSIFGGISKTSKKLIDSGIQFDTQALGDIIAGGFEGYYFNVIETTKKKLWGLSKKKSTDTQTTGLESAILDQIGGIFVYLADAVTGAVDVLGVDMTKTIESFNISLGSISFEGLSGEEIQKKLEDVISQQGDLLAEYVLPQIKEYQKIGEGALETLLRVAKEQAVFNDALDMIGQSLGDMSNLMRIDVAQSIITMMGGLEEFSDSVNLYFKEFFSESEQLDFLTKSLTEAMSGLGYELPMTREGFRALVDSLDLTTEAGQQAFAALMELVPGMAEYFKQIEKQTGALTDYEGAAKAALSMLQKSIQVEKERAQAAYAASQAAYAAEVERINGVKRAIDQVYETLQNNLSNAGGLLTRSLAAESQRIESGYAALQSGLSGAESAMRSSFDAQKSAIQSALELEKSAIQSAADMRVEALSAEASMARQVAGDLKRLQEQFAISSVTVEQALKAARRGDFSLAQQLSPSDVDASGFGSAEEFKAAQAVQAGRLNEIGQLAGTRASAAERAADAAERQIEATKSVADAQIASIDKAAEEQIAALDKQLNELLGINTAVLPLSEAIQKYQEAQNALAEFDVETQREQLSEQQKQADLLMGIDNSVISVVDALQQYRDAQKAIDEFGYESQISLLNLQLANAESMLSLAEKAYQDEIARLDAILLDGQEQLNALLGIDTRILSLTDAVNGFNASIANLAESMKPTVVTTQPVENYVESELREELRQEKENNAAALRAIAKSSERTASIMQRMEINQEALA